MIISKKTLCCLSYNLIVSSCKSCGTNLCYSHRLKILDSIKKSLRIKRDLSIVEVEKYGTKVKID